MSARLRKTHFLRARDSWSFATPALCGVTNWASATDKPKQVTCVTCKSRLAALEKAR